MNNHEESAYSEFKQKLYAAVADGESNLLTRREMHDALRSVANSLQPEGGFER